jgi:hypothetical protein
VSGVKDFSNAFSKKRNDGNLKATFVGTGMSKWDTSSVTDLGGTFYQAGAMNSDLSAWKVGKVTAMYDTFNSASKFVGTGLASWDTSSVTTLEYTFYNAGKMNSDLSAWKVGKVTALQSTFHDASKFVGTGLASWDTSSVTTLESTFTDSIEFNAPIQQWNVEQVTSFVNIFTGATKFDQPVGQWNIVNVKAGGLRDVFQASTAPATTGLSSCNKRLVADAWASNVVFKTTETIGPTNAIVPYVAAWISETCPPQTDATFKTATWDWVNMGARVASAKWGTIDKWDTSGVNNFNNAFSQFRDEDGTLSGTGVTSNAKAASFNADLPWSTESVTSMAYMFDSASAFNGDVSSFNTAAVVDFDR